jgi:hypothetical protein
MDGTVSAPDTPRTPPSVNGEVPGEGARRPYAAELEDVDEEPDEAEPEEDEEPEAADVEAVDFASDVDFDGEDDGVLLDDEPRLSLR